MELKFTTSVLKAISYNWIRPNNKKYVSRKIAYWMYETSSNKTSITNLVKKFLKKNVATKKGKFWKNQLGSNSAKHLFKSNSSPALKETYEE